MAAMPSTWFTLSTGTIVEYRDDMSSRARRRNSAMKIHCLTRCAHGTWNRNFIAIPLLDPIPQELTRFLEQVGNDDELIQKEEDDVAAGLVVHEPEEEEPDHHDVNPNDELERHDHNNDHGDEPEARKKKRAATATSPTSRAW